MGEGADPTARTVTILGVKDWDFKPETFRVFLGRALEHFGLPGDGAPGSVTSAIPKGLAFWGLHRTPTTIEMHSLPSPWVTLKRFNMTCTRAVDCHVPPLVERVSCVSQGRFVEQPGERKVGFRGNFEGRYDS
jgi:hypothetical protein